jgi:hypothetical protein
MNNCDVKEEDMAAMAKSLKIGWAQVNITPDRPVYVVGQMYQRISQYVHDPITATALVLENGEEQVIFISADMTEVPSHALDAVRKNLSVHEGLDFSKVSFHVTHTHNSTEFHSDFLRDDNEFVFGKEILPAIDVPENILAQAEARAFIVDRLTELVGSAWENRRPGGISHAQDYAAVGFNRRPVFYMQGKKETIMYGDCSEPGFLRFEGGSDHSADMLYTWDPEGKLTGVLVDIPCPAQVNELHSYVTADFWAPARDSIRSALGNIYILPACGAAGDQNPLDLVRLSKNNKKTLRVWGGQTKEVFRNFDMTLECMAIGHRITEAVARGYGHARNYIDYNPEFQHEIVDMSLPVRMVSQMEYEEAAEAIASMKDLFTTENPMTMKDVVSAFEPQGIVMRWELQQKTHEYRFIMHVLRIGGVAVVTNPFELFSEFGMRMKARAAAEQVFVIQLSNGIGGYLPSEDAVAGGSYSSKPASTVCGPESGTLLVEKSLGVMNGMWNK